MLDSNWELINGAPAYHIEQLNATNTINVLEALVTFLIAQSPQFTVPLMLTESALCELHRSGTLFLLAKPGAYRDCPVQVGDVNTGAVVYQPPPHEEVPKYMREFFEELSRIWVNGDALDAAAFALWRINWIHPFKNGNGRTARTFSYACLCARLGVMLPGTTTVIDQIMTTRAQYEAALRVCDAAVSQNPAARDLATMKNYLNGLLQIQISSV
jgi:Fic family protein